jgi:hypothetical protein
VSDLPPGGIIDIKLDYIGGDLASNVEIKLKKKHAIDLRKKGAERTFFSGLGAICSWMKKKTRPQSPYSRKTKSRHIFLLSLRKNRWRLKFRIR